MWMGSCEGCRKKAEDGLNLYRKAAHGAPGMVELNLAHIPLPIEACAFREETQPTVLEKFVFLSRQNLERLTVGLERTLIRFSVGEFSQTKDPERILIPCVLLNVSSGANHCDPQIAGVELIISCGYSLDTIQADRRQYLA